MAIGVIFDLDQTLIDSKIAGPYRDRRPKPDWTSVYSLIPQFTVYEGIVPLIQMLASRDVPVAIVTSSPESYCFKVVMHHGLDVQKRVCWLPNMPKKPHPAPILRGVELLGVSAESVWSIGDLPRDIISSNAANVQSIAATWGTEDREALVASGPKLVCHTVSELYDFLKTKIS